MVSTNIDSKYGAEFFQKNYPKYAVLSFFSASLFIALSFAYPIIKSWFETSEQEAPIKVKAKRIINYSELSSPPPIDLEQEEKILKVPPKVKTVKFLEPVAKKDEEVPEIEEMPSIEEMEHSQIGTFDQDGVDSIVVTNEHVIAIPPEEVVEEPYVYVEVMPQFRGGQVDLMNYLSEEIKYPEIAKDAGVEGTVVLQFVIEKDGTISNVTVVRGVHFALDEEAVRVIEDMPDWAPGVQNGENTRVYFTVPIRFKLVE